MYRPAEDKMVRVREDKRLEIERCPRCSRILARMHLAPGSIVEIKCSCNNVAVVKAVLR